MSCFVVYVFLNNHSKKYPFLRTLVLENDYLPLAKLIKKYDDRMEFYQSLSE